MDKGILVTVVIVMMKQDTESSFSEGHKIMDLNTWTALDQKSSEINHDGVFKWKHFRVTGPFWGDPTDHRRIPLIKASDAELWCFLWSVLEQMVKQTTETQMI